MSRMITYWRHCCGRFMPVGSWLMTGGALCAAVFQTFAFKTNSAIAQIIPDATLPNNSSVKLEGNTFNITGGTQAGSNLFHSFREFSVPNGSTAYFNNALDIQNIISRVTGKSVSNIDGLIRASGTANLFLINPSGIIFGKDASLNIGGSFVATTANAIGFGNQGFFSADNPNTPALLTVNPSALLFNQIAAAPIQNNSVAPAGLSPTDTNIFGLRVPNGQSLLLVGGDISIDGSRLYAFGGRVELGGLAGQGTVGLNAGNNLSLNFPEGVARADVSLTKADVNVRFEGGGSIAINAQNLNMTGASRLIGGINSGLGYFGSLAGDIEINATGKINLNNSLISNAVGPTAVGNSGNINISTGLLSVTNGSQISTTTFGKGNAGSITITASDIVSFDKLSSAFSVVTPTGEGNGGSINIISSSLAVTNSSQLATNTFGRGNAGSVNINVRDTVSFDGGIDNEFFASGAGSTVEFGAVGNAGSINITTRSLALTNGAQLTVGTRGQGNGGSLTINAGDTVFFDNLSAAFSSVSPRGEGKGGNINITTGLLFINNNSQLIASTNGKGDAGNVNINARNTLSLDKGYVFSTVQPTAEGKGGDVRITARQLNARDGAQVTVSSEGKGNAGNLEISARSIKLDNQATFTAETALGNGGNITLQDFDLLLMRRGSKISTTAGTAQQGGNGGNITINAPSGFIVAVPSENSDITANAYTGIGGNVQINAFGIYGTQFREKENPQTSDITASSQFGQDGTVELNTPDIDPNTGLINLPTEPVEPQVASGCTAGASQNQSRFVVTGRGGLPLNPREAFNNNDTVRVDWVTLKESSDNRRSQTVTKPTLPTPAPIVEATGWVTNAKGEVLLTASPPTGTPHSSWQTPTTCAAPK